MFVLNGSLWVVVFIFLSKGGTKMAHKITLTGTPLKIRIYGEKVAFDLIEKGSTDAPKGLPMSRDIRYTCLMNKKQFAKLGIQPDDVKNHRFLIQGEPTLDLPTRECPGEIGVIVFKIDLLVPKERPEEHSQETKDMNFDQEGKESPESTTKSILPIDKISIPPEFLEKNPSKAKTLPTIEYVKKTGQVEKPITINLDHVLIDGYRQYYVAKMLGLKEIPVLYSSEIA